MVFLKNGETGFFSCLSTVKFSVLITGASCGFFEKSRGLWEGDPLSSLLFVLVMEAVSKILDKASRDGFISGFTSTCNHLQVTHLFCR